MKTLHEKALHRVAKGIKYLDSHVFTSEYLKNGKDKYRQARLLLFEILEDNGYELSESYNPIKTKNK